MKVLDLYIGISNDISLMDLAIHVKRKNERIQFGERYENIRVARRERNRERKSNEKRNEQRDRKRVGR